MPLSMHVCVLHMHTHLSSAVHLTYHFNVLDESLLFLHPSHFHSQNYCTSFFFPQVSIILEKKWVGSHIPHLQHLGLPRPSELQSMLNDKECHHSNGHSDITKHHVDLRHIVAN